MPDDPDPAPLEVTTQARVVPVEERPPTTRRLGAWWGVVVLAAAGLALVAAGALRPGLSVLATTLWLGAAVRAALPDEAAGGLVVRSRPFDVAVLVVLGGGILVLGIVLRQR